MKLIKLATFCALLFLRLTVSYAQSHTPRHVVIYDTERQSEITLAELVASLEKFDIIFFGEEHNDSIAHALQLELLQAMNTHYKNVALSMEMFSSDDQLVLNEYLSDLITERNLQNDAALWGNYNDYRPMIEYAKTHGLPVLAANAPSRYTNRVSRLGLGSLDSLDKSSKELLAPLPIDTLTGRYYEKFIDLMGGHGGMADIKIYQSQNLWDATMAYRLSKFFKQRNVGKILHLNGRFHSDEQLGTIGQLHNYASRRISTANISCFSSEDLDHPDWESFTHLGNFIILTKP